MLDVCSIIAKNCICSLIKPDHARHLIIIVIDYIWSIIRPDHTNH